MASVSMLKKRFGSGLRFKSLCFLVDLWFGISHPRSGWFAAFDPEDKNATGPKARNEWGEFHSAGESVP